MRNLKKFLALVLAMMMVFGLMVTVNAASDYADRGEIDDKYVSAVDVLTAMGVFKGRNTTDNFAPDKPITRAEFAAILYRIHSGDVEEKNVGNYIGSLTFSDVDSSRWYAGAVGYCQLMKLFVGGSGGKFYPDDDISGYAVTVCLLRALGYDQQGEYQGAGWEQKAMIDGYRCNITKTVGTRDLNNVAATREQIAQLAFDTLTQAHIVYYGSAGTGGYVGNNPGTVGPTLGEFVFEMHQLGASGYEHLDKNIDPVTDPFGRPMGTTWVSNKGEVVVGVGSGNLVATFDSLMTESEIFNAIGAPGIQGRYSKYIVMDRIYQDGALVNWADGKNTSDQVVASNGSTTLAGSTVTNRDVDYWAENSAANCGPTVIVAKGDNTNAAGFGNGTIVEIYDNSIANGANHYIMVIINEYLDKVTSVKAANTTAGTPRSVTVNNMPFETENYKTGDYVLYTKAQGKIQSMTTPETITGKVTYIYTPLKTFPVAQYDVYTIGGKEVKISNQGFQSGVTVAIEAQGTWYVDSCGNIIAEKEVVTPTNYVFVLDAKEGYDYNIETGELTEVIKTTVLFTNGELKTISVNLYYDETYDGSTTGVKKASVSADKTTILGLLNNTNGTKQGLHAYERDEDTGLYKLYANDGNHITGSGSNTDVRSTVVNNTDTINGNASSGLVKGHPTVNTSKKAYATSSTNYYVAVYNSAADKWSVTTFTGYENMPAVANSALASGKSAYVLNNEGTVETVFVNSAAQLGSNSIIYALGSSGVADSVTGKATYDVVVDGVLTTMKLKTSQVTARGLYEVDGAGEATAITGTALTGTEGMLTTTTKLKPATGKTVLGIKVTEGGTLMLAADATDPTTYKYAAAVADTVPVYIFDGASYETIEPSALTGFDAKIAVIAFEAGSVSAIYVVM